MHKGWAALFKVAEQYLGISNPAMGSIPDNLLFRW